MKRDVSIAVAEMTKATRTKAKERIALTITNKKNY